jgi:hypothetical protein
MDSLNKLEHVSELMDYFLCELNEEVKSATVQEMSAKGKKSCLAIVKKMQTALETIDNGLMELDHID